MTKIITDYFKPASEADLAEKRKEEAVKKLQKKLLFKLEYDTVCPTWLKAVFMEEMEKSYFHNIKQFLNEESQKHTVFPPPPLIYSWTRQCTFDQVKVVIIGQDPYHNDGQAMGLSFSVPPHHRPLPPSLLNIYKELHQDCPNFTPPKHGDLTSWARQGVLLLNATLTVRAHSPMSHGKCGWDQFTDAVIKKLLQRQTPTVFMLWGAHAQKRFPVGAVEAEKHLVMRGVHPSPLSASRGFFGCRHFSQCNDFLVARGVEPIDWTSVCKV